MFKAAIIIAVYLLYIFPDVLDIRNFIEKSNGTIKTDGFIEMTVLIIGIYVAIISIFATSATPTLGKLYKKNKLNDFFTLFFCGIIESFILLVFLIFSDLENIIVYYWFIAILSLTIFSFASFSRKLYYMCKINSEEFAYEEERKAKNENDMLACLENIEINTRK